MLRKKNKMGFSLMEMLIVIAIIGILVSIIVPVVTNNAVKAAAAANAANLRSVEGQLSVMMVTNPNALKNSLGQDIVAAANAIIASIEGIIDSTPNWRIMWALTQALLTVEDRVALNVFYAEDELLHLNGLTIDAPNAKALSVDGVTIQKTTEMEVLITEDSIVATYGGMTAEAFAAIAQGGEAGSYTDTDHTFKDSNGDGFCDQCGKPGTPEEIADAIVNNQISGGHSCADADADCKCDECGLPKHIDEVGGGRRGDEPDGYCDREHGGTETLARHAYQAPNMHIFGTPKCQVCGNVENHEVHKLG